MKILGQVRTFNQEKGKLVSGMLAYVKAFELKLNLYQQQASEYNRCPFHFCKSFVGDTSTAFATGKLLNITEFKEGVRSSVL